MLRLETYGDVTRIHMSSRVSEALGYSVSAFMVRDVLIDAGFPGAAADLAAYLDRHRPAGAIITHHHEDHAGNVELLARAGVPLRLADATARALRAHEPIGLYRRIVWGRRTRLTTSAEPFVTDAFALIHSPGHSHDHHVVLDRETGTLFAGDLFLGVKVRMAHHDEDPRLLAASLRDVARLAPARMFDAHRGLVDKPVEMLTAKADWLDETIARIEARIAQGWSDRAITRDVLGAEEAEHYVSFGDLSRINFVRQVRASSGA